MNLLLSWPALSVCTLQEPIWRRGLRRRTLTVCSYQYCVAVAQGYGGARTTERGETEDEHTSESTSSKKQASVPSGARGASDGACRSGL